MSEKVKNHLENTLGPVKRLKFYEFHPDGIIQVKFEFASDAEQCTR
jgi:hypothetical protein